MWKETRSSAVGYSGFEAHGIHRRHRIDRRYRIDVTIHDIGDEFKGYTLWCRVQGARPAVMLKEFIKTVDEAKAIAQADYDKAIAQAVFQ